MSVRSEEHGLLTIPDGLTWATSPDFIAVLEKEYLPRYLAKARWFPGGSANVIASRIVVAIPLRNVRATICHLTIVEIAPHSRYFLPLRVHWSAEGEPAAGNHPVTRLYQGGREGVLCDAATDPEFILALLDHLRREASIATSGWRVDFCPTTKLGRGPIRRPVKTRAIQGEQSNSTSLVDRDYVVKVYRHIEAGLNPEVEMGRFLTDDADFAQSPAVLGNIEAVCGAQTYALGIVHGFVPNHGDAWAWSKDRIRIYLDAAAEGAEKRDTAITVRRDYLVWVRQMGQRVAEMHAKLASRGDLVAFAPEPVDGRDVELWVADLMERVDRVARRLASSPPDGEIIQKLSGQFVGATNQFEEVARRAAGMALGFPKIRQHGDLHLGQVLVVGDDAVIIDFEGEPSRPLAERRRKAPAARDVAGVLRSLDYAAMAANADPAATVEQRALSVWREQSLEAFLKGYFDIACAKRLWPEQEEEARAVLRFFLLEKALYEVEYELAYRPHWLSVPLKGIVRLLLDVNVA